MIAKQDYQCNNFASPTGFDFDVETTNNGFQPSMMVSAYTFS
jgi:hypothetical protein